MVDQSRVYFLEKVIAPVTLATTPASVMVPVTNTFFPTFPIATLIPAFVLGYLAAILPVGIYLFLSRPRYRNKRTYAIVVSMFLMLAVGNILYLFTNFNEVIGRFGSGVIFANGGLLAISTSVAVVSFVKRKWELLPLFIWTACIWLFSLAFPFVGELP